MLALENWSCVESRFKVSFTKLVVFTNIDDLVRAIVKILQKLPLGQFVGLAVGDIGDC